MKATTPKKFRSELKHYFDIADKEAIRINRRSGKNYILLNEDKFLKIKEELQALRDHVHKIDKAFVFESKIKDLPANALTTKKKAKKVVKKVSKKAIKAKKK